MKQSDYENALTHLRKACGYCSGTDWGALLQELASRRILAASPHQTAAAISAFQRAAEAATVLSNCAISDVLPEENP